MLIDACSSVDHYHVLIGTQLLLIMWLLYRLGHPQAQKPRGTVGKQVAEFEGIALSELLADLLEAPAHGRGSMHTWRRKVLEATLDELVDRAVAAGLETSAALAEFADARRQYHFALIAGPSAVLTAACSRLLESSENLERAIEVKRVDLSTGFESRVEAQDRLPQFLTAGT